jgi:hypothetical protein
MAHVTKMLIVLTLDSEDAISEAVNGLPGYCTETFAPIPGEATRWRGEFTISCPVAPELADGDLVDDFAPYFPVLLEMKRLYAAEFELEVAVGAPAPNPFRFESHTIALMAALGASFSIYVNEAEPHRAHGGRADT